MPEPKNGNGRNGKIPPVTVEDESEITGRVQLAPPASAWKLPSWVAQLATVIALLATFACVIRQLDGKAEKSDVAALKSDVTFIKGWLEGTRELPRSSPFAKPSNHSSIKGE